MKKIKVLAIAPYEGLEKLIVSMRPDFPQLEITARTGDLETGVHIAMDVLGEEYDFILTRGGTADMIEKRVSLPVIRIPISGYDYARTVKLAQIYTEKAAIVGFPDITKGAKAVGELLGSKLDIFTIHSTENCEETVSRLKSEGYKIILGDFITQKIAAKNGLHSVMITSGEESVSEALHEIMLINGAVEKHLGNAEMFRSLILQSEEFVAVFSAAGNNVFEKLPFDGFELPADLLLKKNGQDFLRVFSFKEKKWQARVCSIEDVCAGERLTAVYIKEIEQPRDAERDGITIHNMEWHQEHMPEAGNLFSPVTLGRAGTLAASERPTLIIGEPGTGKSNLAHLMHLQGPHRSNPFVQIDCRLIGDETWRKLLSGSFLPDTTQGKNSRATIFLKALDRLPASQQHSLLFALEEGQPFYGYVILASSGSDLDELALAGKYSRSLLDKIAFSHLRIPPLRERLDELSGMYGILISRGNERYGKQLVGIEPAAEELMRAYNWHGNTNQFEQVVDELVMLEEGARISAETTARVLNQQTSSRKSAESFYSIPPDKNLEEITVDIIRIVLQSENGNQSAAAERLAIGRSTLWRKLKDYSAAE